MRPYIGIKMLQLNAQNAAQMQQRDSKFPAITHGILVPSVTAGSPAAKAGLQQGDIITGEHVFIRDSAFQHAFPRCSKIARHTVFRTCATLHGLVPQVMVRMGTLVLTCQQRHSSRH